jgi:hypothetical protein
LHRSFLTFGRFGDFLAKKHKCAFLPVQTLPKVLAKPQEQNFFIDKCPGFRTLGLLCEVPLKVLSLFACTVKQKDLENFENGNWSMPNVSLN